MAIGFPSYYGVHAFIYGLCSLICLNFSSVYQVTIAYCEDRDEAVKYTEKILAFHGRELLYTYLICFGLALIVSVLSWYFNKYYLPSDFATLGKIRGTIGGILRVSRSVLTVISWILLPLSLYAYWISIKTVKCFDDGHDTYVQENARRATLLWIGLWLFQHIAGGIFRSFIDVDVFIVNPEDPTANKYVHFCCETCGP